MWYKSQAVGNKPTNLDAVSSNTIVYVRRNFTRTTNDSGLSVWDYEEQKVLKEDWEAYSQIIGANSTVAISFVSQAENGLLDEVTASEHSELFTEWAIGISYKIGNIRRYSDNLYKCLQAHTSQEGWEPSVAISLWKKIGDPTVEYPEWSQPVGAGDAYMAGDKVSHNDKHWISTVDNNVWEPSVFGWNEVQ